MAFTQEQLDEFKRRYEQDYPSVDESLMQALIKQESAGNPNAVSRVGASGLTQIMPNTWEEINKELGYNFSFDDLKKSPELQKLGGKHYLSKQLASFNNNLPLALAGYNWGPSSVQGHLKKNPNAASDLNALLSSGIPDETKGYINNIMSAYQGRPDANALKKLIEDYKQKMFAGNQGYIRATAKADLSRNPEDQLSEDAQNLTQFQNKISDTYTDPVFERLMKLKKNYEGIQARPELNKSLGIPTIVKAQDAQLGEGQYFSAPDDGVRNETDLLADLIKNQSNQYDMSSQAEPQLAKDTSKSDSLKSLLQQLLQAQTQQSKDAGLLALVKSGGDIADAFAAGRGANTTKLATSGMDFAESQLGQNVQKIKDQLGFRKSEIDLQNLEEANDPNSQLSQMQTGFVKKMAGDLGMDVSSINAMGAKNATELMQSLAYLSKIKGDQDARSLAREEKLKKEMKISDKQAKDITAFDDSITNIQQILEVLGDKSSWTGSGDGRVPDMLVGADQVAWRSMIGLLNDQYRKLITGAAASDKEVKMLQGRLPNATDTYNNFVAKAEAFMKVVSNSRNNYVKGLNRQGKDVSEFETPVEPNLEFNVKDAIKEQKAPQMEMIKNYLNSPNIRPEIKEQLKQKYGL